MVLPESYEKTCDLNHRILVPLFEVEPRFFSVVTMFVLFVPEVQSLATTYLSEMPELLLS